MKESARHWRSAQHAYGDSAGRFAKDRHAARKIDEFTYPWPDNATLVQHTDGLTSHWTLDQYPGVTTRHPSLVAGVLYRDFKRGHDDVAVVVASGGPR